MWWLLFVILAYLCFAVVSLVDKYLLANIKASPKILTFYIGLLGMLAFLLVPWVGFSTPGFLPLVLALGAGALFGYALLLFFQALRLFEASRIVPVVGALTPLLTFLAIFFLGGGKVVPSLFHFASFALLVGGTVLIASERGKRIQGASLRISFLAALFFSLAFVMAKQVYLVQPFWIGFLLMRLGGFAVSLWLFFSSQEVRDEVFGRGERGSEISFRERPGIAFTFLLGQGVGALGEILRNLAVFWVPLGMLPFIHALQGVEYVFLLLFAVLLSLKFPRILKEELSGSALFHKIVAVLLIGVGLILLAVA